MAYSTGGKRSVIVYSRKNWLWKIYISNCDKIICHKAFDVASSFQGVTSTVQSANESVSIEGNIYDITIIDTVGFQDCRPKGGIGLIMKS